MSVASDSLHPNVALNRQQVAEAVMQGYLDADLATELSTAKSNGYALGKQPKSNLAASFPVGGVNR